MIHSLLRVKAFDSRWLAAKSARATKKSKYFAFFLPAFFTALSDSTVLARSTNRSHCHFDCSNVSGLIILSSKNSADAHSQIQNGNAFILAIGSFGGGVDASVVAAAKSVVATFARLHHYHIAQTEEHVRSLEGDLSICFDVSQLPPAHKLDLYDLLSTLRPRNGFVKLSSALDCSSSQHAALIN